jgi:hypothetical protein
MHFAKVKRQKKRREGTYGDLIVRNIEKERLQQHKNRKKNSVTQP